MQGPRRTGGCRRLRHRLGGTALAGGVLHVGADEAAAGTAAGDGVQVDPALKASLRANGGRMVTVAKWRDGAIAEEYIWM